VLTVHRLEYPLIYLAYAVGGACFAVVEVRQLLGLAVLLAVAANMLLIVSGLALNTAMDMETDRRQAGREYLASAAIRLGRGRIVRYALTEMIIAIGLAAAVSARSGRPNAVVAAAVIIALQVLYNLEPVRLKRRGFLGVTAFCGAVVMLPFTLSYFAVRGGIDISVWPILLGVGMLAIGRMTWWSVPDRMADAATGMRTPAVRHGAVRALAASSVIMLVGLIMTGWGLWWRFGPGWAIPAVATHGGALVILHRAAIPSATHANRHAMPLVAIGELVLMMTPLAAGPGFAGEAGVHAAAFRVEADIVHGFRAPQRHRHDARFNQREVAEEPGEFFLATQVDNRPVTKVHLIEHGERVKQILVLAEMRQGKVTTGGHRVGVGGDHRLRLVAIRDVQQRLDQQDRDRFAQVKLPGPFRGGKHIVRLPDVFLQERDIVKARDDISAILHQAGVDLDIHDARIRRDGQGHLMHVVHCRYAGTEVKKLPDVVGQQVTHHPPEQGPLRPHEIGDMRRAHGRVVSELAVDIAVMRPVQPVVANTGDIGLDHALLACPLDRNVMSHNAVHPVTPKHDTDWGSPARAHRPYSQRPMSINHPSSSPRVSTRDSLLCKP
jgi:lycopene elongase/hydratase (dihydrobisanhydrobacterioruberin-forming)